MRTQIKKALLQELAHTGESQNKLAIRLGVSVALVSNILNDKWQSIRQEKWLKISNVLQLHTNWQIVEQVTNYQILQQELLDAQEEAYFTIISEKAGSGKTACLKQYSYKNRANHVFYIEAGDWSKGDFMDELIAMLGIQKGKGYVKVKDRQKSVLDFFKKGVSENPLLIIDEADKLRPSALQFIIPLFNKLEDQMGLVIAGVENLQKQIENGVRLNKKGYDEIESRLGRLYKKLVGVTKKDLGMIYHANGVLEEAIVQKIWEELPKKNTYINNKNIAVVTDFRRLKRRIKVERRNKERLVA